MSSIILNICPAYEFTLLSNILSCFPKLTFVCLPHEFTLLSNQRMPMVAGKQFVYHMNLHYSQTSNDGQSKDFSFVYHMNLHYSQTKVVIGYPFFSLSTTWIYTTLKLPRSSFVAIEVCLPHEFTLLSNPPSLRFKISFVCLPHEFTLLSN